MDSAYGILEAAKLEYTTGILDNQTNEKVYIFPQSGTEKLEFSGSEPEGGTLKVTVAGKIALAIHNGTWCVKKGFDDPEVSIEKYEQNTCEINEIITPEKCFVFDSNTGTITKYNKDDSDCGIDVVIPNTIGGIIVKAIGPAAFIEGWDGNTTNNPTVGDTKKLNSIVLPSGLESIGSYAFSGIYNESATFNQIVAVDFSKTKNLTTIGEGAFVGNSITSLNLSNATNLNTIGTAAFGANKLTSLNLSNLINVTTIGESAFSWNQLTDVTFGAINKLESIGQKAFCNSDGSTILPNFDNIPTSVTSNNTIRCIGT